MAANYSANHQNTMSRIFKAKFKQQSKYASEKKLETAFLHDCYNRKICEISRVETLID